MLRGRTRVFVCAVVACVALGIPSGVESLAGRASGGEKVAPVRMGAGLMTFDTVPGWGLGEDGKSQIGPTHGSVVIDKAGNILHQCSNGVCLYSHRTAN